jgi:hypothetical protein
VDAPGSLSIVTVPSSSRQPCEDTGVFNCQGHRWKFDFDFDFGEQAVYRLRFIDETRLDVTVVADASTRPDWSTTSTWR